MLIALRRVMLLASLIGLAVPSSRSMARAHERSAIRTEAGMHEHRTVDATAAVASTRESVAIAPMTCRDCDQPCTSHPSCHSRIGCSASVGDTGCHASRVTMREQDSIAVIVLTPPGAWRGAPRSPPPRA